MAGYAGLLATLALGMFWLSGCDRAARKPDLHDLFISNRRFNIDRERDVVRVFARLENTGERRFREVEVHAILLSAGGDKRGENSVLLERIRPREQRDFAVTVTSHGRANDVVLEIREPQRP
jgi:hypothetical protein